MRFIGFIFKAEIKMAKFFENKSIMRDYLQFNSPHGYICISRDASLHNLWRVYRILSAEKLKFLGYAKGNKSDPFQLYKSFISNKKDMQLKLEKKG
jgi:hypothetical protein